MGGNDNHRILQALMAAQTAVIPVVLATVVKARGSVPRHAGTKMLVYADGRIEGTVGGGEMESRVIVEAQAALQDGQTRTIPYSLVEPGRGDPGVCGGEMEVFVEPYLPPATVYVIGCGHVGRAVADLAHWLGYRVIAYDDRAELATSEFVPNADVYLTGDIGEAIAQHPISSNTFVVLVTRNVMVDRGIMPHLAETEAGYIGVMGSKRRWQHTHQLLLDDGLTEAQLAKFHAPIGLELNAESPREIALSILSEIIMLRRDGTGERMAVDGA